MVYWTQEAIKDEREREGENGSSVGSSSITASDVLSEKEWKQRGFKLAEVRCVI